MRRVEVAPGIELDVIDEGSGETGVAVLLHGFPESSHSWRHQVQPLVAAGWRVLAPDQRGYASSTAPSDISAYRGDILADDVIALLDDIDARPPKFIESRAALLIRNLANQILC